MATQEGVEGTRCGAPETASISPPAAEGSARRGGQNPATRGPSRLTRPQVMAASGMALLLAAGAGYGVPKLFAASPRAHTSPIELVSKNVAPVTQGAQITVTGSATVQGRPDTATFQIGVHSEAATATEALAANNGQVSKLERSLSNSGVPTSGMQTSQLDIYANTNKAGDVTGFSVDDDLTVTMHDVAAVGAALDSAAQAVGNGVSLNNISFSITNSSALLAEARAAAMQNAHTEASQLASGAGVTLGPIVKVVDEENSEPQPNYGEGMPLAAAASDVPVEAGNQPLSVQVSVVYSLGS